MLAKLFKRTRILSAYLHGEGSAKDVPLTEALHSTFQVYGLKKWLLKRRASIELVDELCRFTLDGRTVYWPKAADAGRLVDMYFEVNCTNTHQFDCTMTPVEA